MADKGVMPGILMDMLEIIYIVTGVGVVPAMVIII